MFKRVRLHISGVVQGVGFRPFVYRVAQEFDIKGYVLNNSLGVLVDAEGEGENLDRFVEQIRNHPPKNALIKNIEIESSPKPLYRKEFLIKESSEGGNLCAMLPTDKSICPECLLEMRDKNNRRHEYPFINCVECGPRYTIIKTLPYDRDKTSMDSFVLCKECAKEYENPLDRRFHAEPNSCPKCGPKLSLYRSNGSLVIEGMKSIETAAKLIKKGEIVAIKGMGGFHIVCDASKSGVVLKLRERKNRPTKPFAVMFASFSDILKCAEELDETRSALINSSERPIVLVKKRKPHRLEKFCIACDVLAPNNSKMGVFLPYTPLHILLMDRLHCPIVCTSANTQDEAIITKKEDIFERLSSVVGYVLDYDRDIVNPCDDSVIDVFDSRPLFVRRARGYAPINIKAPKKSKNKILALGASQKSSIAVCFEDNILLSPHIGDIDNLDTFEYFKKTVELFMKLYEFKPDIVIHDAHPLYASTKYAKSLGIKTIEVYHHHAHTLSLAGEIGMADKKVLGIVWDGSGYGEDGTIWGGEFLEVEGIAFSRIGSIKPFFLLGGEKAIKEPLRVLFSLLYDYFGDEHQEFLCSIGVENIELLKQMQDEGINSVKTTSMGRIFDAVAVLLGLISTTTYDGEAGVYIESLYDPLVVESYPFSVNADNQVELGDMLLGLLKERCDLELAASKFINTLALIALHFAKKSSLPTLLSGGVFQNGALLCAVKRVFEEEGVEYHTHSKLPSNDGGIAFGQSVYGVLL